jgi:diguanylate cyclase (GGDEF)-like protein
MRILLVEDDEVLLDVLLKSLINQHYIVDAVEDGQTAWEYAQSANYDLILMDVGLPKLDGITLCQKLRADGCSTPILLITARDASSDRIRGLDAGADDYLIKPLDLGELQARVRALLRRKEVAHTTILQVGELRLDPGSCQVSYAEKQLILTPKEYSLLELFLRNPSQVFSRSQIIDHLWTLNDPPLEESVKAHIKGLRQKLKAAGAVDWIENVYGIGYRLQPPIESKSDIAQKSRKGGETKKQKENIISSFPDVPIPASNPPSSIEQQFNQAREGLWEQYRGLMTQRLAVLQAAATAVQSKDLSEKLRQEARQAAHKLAGVLGMFERDVGTVVARELEEILLGDKELLPAQEQMLLSLVQQLSELLDLAEPKSADNSSIQPTEIERKPTSAPTAPSNSLAVKVLVVDDDPVFLAALHPMLEPWGIQLTGLDDPLRFWEVLQVTAPDLLILDVEMPKRSGIELCQSVRADSHWQSLPILFLTAHCDRQIIQQVFSAGADDYITKPIVGPELLTRITNRLERLRLLQTLSTKDPLTGLANQPQSSQNLERLLRQTLLEKSKPLSLVLFTVEALRQINLKYGHATGNHILQRWGQLLRSTFGEAKGLGYWGNGEFVVELSGSKQEVNDRLSQLLTTLRQQIFTAPDGNRFQATFSLGVAEYPTDGLTLQSLYQAASAISAKGVSDG